MVGLPVLSVLTMGISHTKQPPYDFLNLYGACLQTPHQDKRSQFYPEIILNLAARARAARDAPRARDALHAAQ
jgi:hypothetical protein